jgi:hypothetical protein
MDERRKHERRKNERKSTNDYFLLYDLDTEDLLGRVLDFSLDGFMLMTEGVLPVGRVYNCRLQLARNVRSRQAISFEAETKWCTQNKKWKWFETGFKIENISKPDLKIIKEIVEGLGSTHNTHSTPAELEK